MTPFRIKPSLVGTPISEHVLFSDEGYSQRMNVACSNETLDVYYKPLNMPILRVFCCALLFILRYK